VDPTEVEEGLPDDARSDPVIRRWGHADCHWLTIALHRRTGWPIVTLHNGRIRGGSRYLDDFGILVHSGVACPDGRFLDIRGLHDKPGMEALAVFYLDECDYPRWNDDASEDDLLEILPASEIVDPSILESADAIIHERLSGVISAASPVSPTRKS
jgi:hypothetical protein